MIRNDFVSNSSSSSFMVVGHCFERSELLDKIKDLPAFKNIDEDKILDRIYDYFNSRNLIVYHGLEEYGSNYYCIGMTYSQMLKDETREEFENRIQDAFKTLKIPCESHVEIMTDGGYN